MKKVRGLAFAAVSLVAVEGWAAVPLRTVVANGEPAPGVTNGLFRRPTSASISPSGRVAFVSGIYTNDTGDQGRGIWVEGAEGLTFVARLQGNAPGGGTFDNFAGTPVAYGDGLTFSATASGTSGLFALDGATLRAVVRAGDTVGTQTVGVLPNEVLTNAKGDSLAVDGNGLAFHWPRTGAGAFVIGEASLPLLSDDGHIAVLSTSGGAEPAIRFGTSASLAAVATRKQAGPGMVGKETFEAFGNLAMGSDGFLVFVGGALDEDTLEGWDGLFTRSVSGELSLVSKLPIAAGNVQLQTITEIDVAFGSVYLLRGSTVPDGQGISKQALVVRRGGAFVPIAVQGEPAPGAGGATYGELSDAHINKDGAVVFQATLAGTGVTPENATAVYMLTSPTAAAPEIVVRAGTPVDLGGGRGTVTPTVVGLPSMSRRGGPRTINEAGEAVLALRYPFDGSDGNALLVTGKETVEVGAPDLVLIAERALGEEGADKQNLPGGEFLIRAVVENKGTDLATDVRLELAGENGKKLTIVGGQGPWQCGTDCRGLALRPGEKHEGFIRVASDIPNTVTLTASVPGSVDPTPADNVRTVTLETFGSAREIDLANDTLGDCSCRMLPRSTAPSGVLSAIALGTAFVLRRRGSKRSCSQHGADRDPGR